MRTRRFVGGPITSFLSPGLKRADPKPVDSCHDRLRMPTTAQKEAAPGPSAKKLQKPVLIDETEEDIKRNKRYARKHAGWLGHALEGWQKWHRTELGGVRGWIRRSECLYCGALAYIFPNGSTSGFPLSASCPVGKEKYENEVQEDEMQ